MKHSGNVLNKKNIMLDCAKRLYPWDLRFKNRPKIKLNLILCIQMPIYRSTFSILMCS